MFLATRYSLAFCMRHSRKESLARLFIAANNTVLLYLGIQVTGKVVNAVEKMLPIFRSHPPTFGEFLKSEMFQPLVFLVLVLLYGLILGRAGWYFQSKWNITLRQAERRENNDFRARLDVARVRSKEYDDLNKRIQELPTSWQTRMWFADQMMNLFSTLVSFILFGLSLLWYKPIYAVVIFFTALPMMMVEFGMTAKWWALYEKLIPHNKRRHVLDKAFGSGMPFVQALMFNQLPELRLQIEKNSNEVNAAYDEIRKHNVKLEFPVTLISIFGLGGVLIHSIFSVFPEGSIGTLTIIMAAARTFHGNLDAVVSMVAQQWNSAKGVILIEKDFAGLEPIVQTKNPIKPSFERTPQIKFDRVWFKYPDNDGDILKDVSFTIDPGTKTAIVGRSGHGKSTIQALMTRLYDPTAGTISADGINLKNIRPQDWNNWVAALTQDYSILERRVDEEIASSRLDRPMNREKILKAAYAAHLDEVVQKHAEGYEAQIGTEMGGREFSGGERQRFALARVLYRETPILILDEPDAKLDPESAQKVMDNIFELTGVTIVLITHHVSHAQRCDKIIVMHEGEIAEMGSHTELMEKNEMYANLFRKDEGRVRLAVS